MFRNIRYILLAAPLALGACGEGWDMVRTDKMVPYGNTRTAGTGVAYVLAKMMPEKDLKLAPAAPPVAAPPPPAPKAKAEEVFRKSQSK